MPHPPGNTQAILTKMPRSSLDAVRARTGAVEGPDVVQALRRLPVAEVDTLAEELVATPPRPRSVVPANEIWPLVNARASLLSRGAQAHIDAPGPAGLNLMAAMSPRELGRATFSTSVLRALLYGHGLLIEDPLVMAAELHVASSAQTRRLSRAFVEAAAASLAEIDVLVDAGIVQTFFVPTTERREGSLLEAEMLAALQIDDALSADEIWEAFEAGYVDGLSPSLREIWVAVRSGDRHPPLELIDAALTETDVAVVRTFVDVVASLRPQGVVDNTVAIVASAVDDVRRLGARHDVLCASPLFARLLFLGTSDPVAELRVRQLARTPVPNIEELSVHDVVSVRQQSDAFETWRRHLSNGLDAAHRLRDELGPDVDLAAQVSEELAEARERLAAEAKASSVLGRAGWIAFTAGTLGGAISEAGGDVAAAALGGAGGLAAAFAERALRRARSPSSARRRHYVVFDRPADELAR